MSDRSLGRTQLLDAERGGYLKKWSGRLPVALIYPNSYRVGMSSLGFQLVYALLNDQPHLVCERFFLSDNQSVPVSLESGRLLNQFSVIVVSISFEQDYPNLLEILFRAGIEPLAANRQGAVAADSPLVIGGGVATFINPEPIAPFFDLIAIGEAEEILASLSTVLETDLENLPRKDVLLSISRQCPSWYVPAAYAPEYDEQGICAGYSIAWPGMPTSIKRAVYRQTDVAGHSQIVTQHTEFANLHLTELGRGCSRSCRFCAAGFVYRPPRKWSEEAIRHGVDARPEHIERVGLLGMEMTEPSTLDALSSYLLDRGCQLSFSSLRADALSENLLSLLAQSGLKSVAIAPDGCSERLRRVINKNLREADIIDATERLARAGVFKLKIYLMVGLPTETDDDLAEALNLIRKIKESIDSIGRRRGRLTEIVISVNCFIPKAWTPFQYHCFGASDVVAKGQKLQPEDTLAELKRRLRILSSGVKSMSNVHMQHDKPENALFQAVLAKGDRRLAPVLLTMVADKISFSKALQIHNLHEADFALLGYDSTSWLPWYIIDHGIRPRYLWREYQHAFAEQLTEACCPEVCRKCGVCHDEVINQ